MGLSDIERGEVRALTIHAFTNQPARLMRVLRFAARMGFKLEVAHAGMVRPGGGARSAGHDYAGRWLARNCVHWRAKSGPPWF